MPGPTSPGPTSPRPTSPGPASLQAPAPPSTGAFAPRIAVGLAERHDGMRSSLRQLFHRQHDIDVVFEATHIDALLGLLATQPDVLVVDASICEQSCAATLARIVQTAPSVPIVGLTMHSGPRFAESMIMSGATGVVLKDMAAEDLPDAVRAASLGHPYLSRPLQAHR